MSEQQDAIKEDLIVLMEKHGINRLKVDVLVSAYPDPIISDDGRPLSDDWQVTEDFRIFVADVVCQECEGEGGDFFLDDDMRDFAPDFIGQKIWCPCEYCQAEENERFCKMPDAEMPLWIARWAHKVKEGGAQ